MTDKASENRQFGRVFKSVAAGAAALVLSLHMAGNALAADRVKVEWWNAASGRLAEITKQLISDFNASQDKYEIVGVSKGNYEETMAAMVAAYRVGQQPVLIQAAERGFLTMHRSGAIIPVPELMEREGYKINWNDFVGPVAGFYLIDGKPAAMPFKARLQSSGTMPNSSRRPASKSLVKPGRKSKSSFMRSRKKASRNARWRSPTTSTGA